MGDFDRSTLGIFADLLSFPVTEWPSRLQHPAGRSDLLRVIAVRRLEGRNFGPGHWSGPGLWVPCPEVASLHGQVAPPISSSTFRARGVQLTFFQLQGDEDFGRETFTQKIYVLVYLFSASIYHSLAMRLSRV